MSRAIVLRAEEDHRLAEVLVKSLLKDGFSAHACAAPPRGSRDPVVVLWSEASWSDKVVRSAARRARRKSRLLQAHAADPASRRGLGKAAPLDLAGWRGALADPRFRLLTTGLKALADGETPPAGLGYARPRIGLLTSSAGAAVVAFFAVLGALMNLVEARERVCSVKGLAPLCARVGFAPAPTAAHAKFVGAWGPVGCPVRGTLKIEGDVLSWDWGDHLSAAHIEGEGKDSLYLVEISPDPGGRSELRVAADRMTVQVLGQPGETELFRCAARR